MVSLRKLITVSDTDLKNAMYEHFLYCFPEQIFWDKVNEMEMVWEIPVGEFVRDELWLKGIVENRGEYRIGPYLRKKIKQFLFNNPMPLPKREVKNQNLRNRQIEGLAQLKAFGEKHNYLILHYNPESSLMMWDKCKTGILLNAGRSFAYVYQCGFSFSFERNMPLVGYFQLSSGDVIGKLKEALNGQMKERTAALSERRKAFAMRQKARWERVNAKRKEAVTN